MRTLGYFVRTFGENFGYKGEGGGVLIFAIFVRRYYVNGPLKFRDLILCECFTP